MKIEISDEVGLQLKELAKERNLTIEELVSDMLEGRNVVRNSVRLTEESAKSELTAPEAGDACPPYLAKQATERGISPERLAELLEKEYPPGSMGRLAQVAVKAGIASEKKVDTSARSREILNSEFADFIDRRIRK
ncbi:MAG: hypothetical protein OXN88_00580 [Chloroflexota bacterium]|nr:hypothetical protein [Chloroflexota bacterium]